MKKNRRKFSSEFKLKVILDALGERQTLSELSQKYELHPNQISSWKQEFLRKAQQIMTLKTDDSLQGEKEKNELYAKIGQLQMEVEYLKKRLS